MFPPRPNCPADETSMVVVLVGSKFGADRLPGNRNTKSRKLRPLSGRLVSVRSEIQLETCDMLVSTPTASDAEITKVSAAVDTLIERLTVGTSPTRASTLFTTGGAKPRASTLTS